MFIDTPALIVICTSEPASAALAEAVEAAPNQRTLGKVPKAL